MSPSIATTSAFSRPAVNVPVTAPDGVTRRCAWTGCPFTVRVPS
ncbi:hypothetical protein [Actinomadura madurae]|nr:hypothetical protein [Actinomadura madurae]